MPARSPRRSAKPATDSWLAELELAHFVALDVETTGLDSSKDQIIEVGAARFENGQVRDHFESFVSCDRALDPFIVNLTGISDADLAGAPRFDELAESFTDFLGSDPLVGQNVDFDLGFLRAAGQRVPSAVVQNHLAFTKARVLDTAMLARVFWPEFPSFSLSYLVDAFGAKRGRAHRAASDAEATGRVLAEMVYRLPSRVWRDLAVQLYRLIGATTHRSRFFFARLMDVASDSQFPAPEQPSPSDGDASEILRESMNALLGDDGLLEQKLSFFKARPAQLEMSEAIESGFRDPTVLLVEAPTGVGKSLAYLVPALQWVTAASSDAPRQAVISSYTKVLQDQLWRKDVANIETALGTKVRAAVLKGRGNYLCRRRLTQLLRDAQEKLSENDRVVLMLLIRWSALTSTGDISEISGFNARHYSFLWAQVCSDAFACSSSTCGASRGDFYRAAQDRAAKAHLLFVNHALLASDLPRLTSSQGVERRFVLDEAHQLERAMVSAMTSEISTSVIRNVLLRFVSEKSSRGLLAHLISRYLQKTNSRYDDRNSIAVARAQSLIPVSRQAFGYLGEQLVSRLPEGVRSSKLRFRYGDRVHQSIREALDAFVIEWRAFLSWLEQIESELGDLRGEDRVAPDLLFEFKSAADSARLVDARLHQTMYEQDQTNVTWVEFGLSQPGTWAALYGAPISIAETMERAFWPAVKGVVLTSATLTAAGTFEMLKSSLGLSNYAGDKLRELALPSPFSMKDRMRVFVPTFLPDPRLSNMSHAEAVVELVRNLVRRFDRGTLVLCTSNDLVERITAAVGPVLQSTKRVLLSHGSSDSLSKLVGEFRQRRNAVLVGSTSLWEGIDVVGEALQMIVVTRLPFDVPTDPWFAARCDALQDAGGDPFTEYGLPQATLRLKQGLGRLIRHPADYGIAVLADPRLVTARYGRVIRESLPLPPMPVSDEVELHKEIDAFFRTIENDPRT